MLKFFNLKKWFKGKDEGKSVFNFRIKKIFWGLLFLAMIVLILIIDIIPNQIDLMVGQVSKKDIAAPRTISFIDQEKTEELKKNAAQSAPRVYEEDINVNNRIKTRIHSFFAVIETKKLGGKDVHNKQNGAVAGKQDQSANIEQLESINLEQLVLEIKQDYGTGLNDETIMLFLQAPSEINTRLEKTAIEIMDRQLKERILPGDLPKVKDNLAQEALKMDLSKEYRLALANILENMIQPNMILNQEATQRRQTRAIKLVEPVKRTVQQGEIILRKGDVVIEDDIKVLEALGLQKPRFNYLNFIGIIIVVLTIIMIANYFFYQYKKQLWEDQKKIIFLELMVIIVLILAKIANFFQISYLVPVAIASILTTVLINTDTAVILTIFLSFLVALVFNNDFNIALISFIGGLVGIFSVSKVNQRNDLVRAGFNVGGVLAILILGLTLSDPANDWLMILKSVGIGILNGVLVAILSNGLLPYLENAFNLASSVKLLELSNPSQPLLRRLLVEAPGTYHHCVIVGNLAETAADKIGANSLVTRVGAYYHDIGKIKRPYFFIDNQFGGENPHNKLSPNLSSLIIKSHVKDGVELAKEYKLPEAIIDIIKQHHGTNLISFFYQEALKDNKHDSVIESDFHYDGPKPQSKEAAIIMLADIVEATLRSKQFNKNNHNRIEVVTRKLIRDKLIEGQLDESELTLHDLDIIVKCFVKVLTGIYHQRIEYPEKLLKEMKKGDKNDKSRDK